VRVLLGIFYFAFLFAVTWPGMLPFNRIEPRVLGLPFAFAWPALWVTASFFVLAALDRSEDRPDDEEGR
jgi:hypothetical protein